MWAFSLIHAFSLTHTSTGHLQAVPVHHDAYGEARRLLEILRFFDPIPAEILPQTAMLREFVGGSWLLNGSI